MILLKPIQFIKLVCLFGTRVFCCFFFNFDFGCTSHKRSPAQQNLKNETTKIFRLLNLMLKSEKKGSEVENSLKGE